MSSDPDIVPTSPNWRAVWTAGISAGLVASFGIMVRLALLHDVSPLEDLILRTLQDHGVSFVLWPNWTEPLVGLTEIAGSAGVGAGIGLIAAALRWSTCRATCLAAVVAGLVQVLFGLLPRVPL